MNMLVLYTMSSPGEAFFSLKTKGWWHNCVQNNTQHQPALCGARLSPPGFHVCHTWLSWHGSGCVCWVSPGTVREIGYLYSVNKLLGGTDWKRRTPDISLFFSQGKNITFCILGKMCTSFSNLCYCDIQFHPVKIYRNLYQKDLIAVTWNSLFITTGKISPNCYCPMMEVEALVNSYTGGCFPCSHGRAMALSVILEHPLLYLHVPFISDMHATALYFLWMFSFSAALWCIKPFLELHVLDRLIFS